MTLTLRWLPDDVAIIIDLREQKLFTTQDMMGTLLIFLSSFFKYTNLSPVLVGVSKHFSQKDLQLELSTRVTCISACSFYNIFENSEDDSGSFCPHRQPRLLTEENETHNQASRLEIQKSHR